MEDMVLAQKYKQCGQLPCTTKFKLYFPLSYNHLNGTCNTEIRWNILKGEKFS